MIYAACSVKEHCGELLNQVCTEKSCNKPKFVCGIFIFFIRPRLMRVCYSLVTSSCSFENPHSQYPKDWTIGNGGNEFNWCCNVPG